MAFCQIHQIYYSDASRLRLDPGYLPFCNFDDRRDWREYPAFQRLFRETWLDERILYGAWSPKFAEKTGLGSAQVHDYVQDLPDETDIVLFCPYIAELCLHQSVVHQGENRHPGLLRTTLQLMAEAGRPMAPDQFNSHAFDGIYCNFFAAKPAFWRAWFEVADLVLDPMRASAGLRRRLDQPVPYRDGTVPMGVFVLERLASILLAQDRSWRVAAYSPFSIARGLGVRELESYIMLDALKGSYARTGNVEYLESFHAYRNALAAPRRVA